MKASSDGKGKTMRVASGVVRGLMGVALAVGVPGAWAQTAPGATTEAVQNAAKAYRLTYTVTEMDGSRRVGTQHLAMVVVAGQETVLKQGSKVPVVTGRYNATSSAPHNEVQYLDIGLNVVASLSDKGDGLRLSTKLEQSSLAEDKPGADMQDPVIRQTMLEGASILTEGKPLMLGSLDIPGTTRRLDVEATLEAVR